MNLAGFIEKLDSTAYQVYNFLTYFRYIVDQVKFGRCLEKNKHLYNTYKGKRCFVVLNGPSLNLHDLALLEKEYVFCVNYMYRSDLVDILRPDFYCWCDSTLFRDENYQMVLDELMSKCYYSKFFFTHHYILNGLELHENVYVTYSRHMPSINGVRFKLHGLSSNFQTVALYAMNCALYMGFEHIYLLGYDFEPGAFKHFSDLGIENYDPCKDVRKNMVCGNYWCYSKAHYENYYISELAECLGINIINLNPDSHIRAFPFDLYERIV